MHSLPACLLPLLRGALAVRVRRRLRLPVRLHDGPGLLPKRQWNLRQAWHMGQKAWLVVGSTGNGAPHPEQGRDGAS